jgi:glycyl-tRNA synthetase beta chain
MGASKDSKIPDPQIVLDEVIDYLNERLRGALMDEFAGITTEVVDSVLALDIHSPIAIERRALAVVEFLKSPEAPALSGAQKRIVNLFKKSAPNSINLDKQIQFDSPEENELYAALVEFKPQVELLAQNGQFTEALLLSSKMRKPIDNFFENVMVMAEDPQIRERRLALLHAVRSLFLTVADLSYLPG